jgi:2-hydroxychromene-2-carboxylate isomerase
VEDPLALAAILREVGADTTTFWRYSAYEAAWLKACFAEAEHDQVFGVPTFVIDVELF